MPTRSQAALLGLAAGDAVGTAVEFRARGSFTPLTDMVGGGHWNLEKGQWTDDTSMALCLAASLLETRAFDPTDQMDRYCRWRDRGYFSSNGRCFDIGGTVGDALDRYQQSGNPYAGSTHPRSAGNGSIMRLAPIPIAYHRDCDRLLYHAGESSRTTHACEEAVESCRLFALQIGLALQGCPKDEILTGHGYESTAPMVSDIARAIYLDRTYDDLEGSGYVIESLASALWCFANTDTFEAAVLAAANIGNDADTTAAVCGQIAGAFYGLEGIPGRWREVLTMADEIAAMAEQLFHMFEREA